MNYWLVKSEPETWSWDDHVKKGVEPWDGVRNFQARKYMNEMRIGDLAFFYHSGKKREIVGVLEVVGEARPDPTDETGRFVVVDFKALNCMPNPVTLQNIKNEPDLSEIALLKQSRLSVMPIEPDAWQKICSLGDYKE